VFGNTGIVKAIRSMKSVLCILAVRVWKSLLEPSLPASCPPVTTSDPEDFEYQRPNITKESRRENCFQGPYSGRAFK